MDLEQQTALVPGFGNFSDDYQLNVFMLWYNSGKPNFRQLSEIVTKDPISGKKPSDRTLQEWINTRFIVRALELDQSISEKMEQELVQQRVEMLNRHAVLGMKMQDMGIVYLEEHGVGSARNAITLLVRGIEVEHEARIAPSDLLARLDKMSDTELLDELRQHVAGTIVDISPVDTDTRNPNSEDEV